MAYGAPSLTVAYDDFHPNLDTYGEGYSSKRHVSGPFNGLSVHNVTSGRLVCLISIIPVGHILLLKQMVYNTRSLK